jgi:putative transcriptional regulator
MDFDFFHYKNKLQPEKGRLLISEPFLPDPNFERTVVLLCEHNKRGSFGFVLNKPSIATVKEVMDHLPIHRKVFIGGPVQQDTLHYIHRIDDLADAIPVGDGIFWGGDFDALVTGLDTGGISEADVRFFLGYSGWASGQLEEELKENSWIVCNYLSVELLFHSSAQAMWKKVLSDMGGRFSIYANYPVNPKLN